MTRVAANVPAQHWLGIVLLITIVWTISMGIEASQFDRKQRPVLGKLESPVGALELADTPDRVRAILDQGDRDRNVTLMRYNTYMDFLFILLYCTMFWLFADSYTVNPLISRLMKFIIVFAGIFDCAENFGMLRQFRNVADLNASVVQLTRTVSLTKWALLALASWLLGAFLITVALGGATHAGLLKWIAGLIFISAGTITVGLFVNSIISFMALPFLIALLIAVKVFWPL